MNPRSQFAELFKLPVDERMELVEALWDSIAADSSAQAESPELIALVQERIARYEANPESGMSWEEARKRMPNS